MRGTNKEVSDDVARTCLSTLKSIKNVLEGPENIDVFSWIFDNGIVHEFASLILIDILPNSQFLTLKHDHALVCT